MKRLFLFIFLLLLIIIPVSVITYTFRDDVMVTIRDWMNIRPQQYYGVTVDMGQILPESQNYIVNSKGEDLIDISAKLGINVFRITNIRSISNDSATPSYSYEQWNEVLNKMKKKGIYAIILVEGNNIDTKFHNLKLRDYHISFIKEYIVTPNVCSFSNVLAIDIANEPILNKKNLATLKTMSQLVKSSCPNTKITIGSWRTDDGKKDKDGQPEYNWHDPKEVRQINDIVDMHSVHIYGFDKPKDGKYPDSYVLTTGYLKEIKKYTDKPIFIEEFGAGNGNTITDQKTIGSEELQKKAYEGVLKASYDFKNRGVLGATAYLLLPRFDKPESWNIIKDKGDTFLPAAYTFKTYSN